LHPKEKLFYDCIFDFIRKDRNLVELSGPEIYPTLASSGLQRPVLTEIWKATNIQNRKGLTREDLYIALRMISLVQHHGVTPEIEALQENIKTIRSVKPPKLRPPVEFQQYYRQKQAAMKSGMSESAPPMRPASQNPFVITELQRDSYLNFFHQLDVANCGVISGAQAKTFLEKSNLPPNDLRRIWLLSDIDQDGQLDAHEFCVAMQLIMVLRKNLCPLPATLPPSLNPKSGMTPGGSHMTPGGPSVTPGGPSMMPGPNIAAPAMTPPVAQPIIAPQHRTLPPGADNSGSLIPGPPGLGRQISNTSVPERRLSNAMAPMPSITRQTSADTNLFAPPSGSERKQINELRDNISKEFSMNMDLKERVLKQEEISAKSQQKLDELKSRLQAYRDKNNELRIQLKVEEERQEGNASQTKALLIEKGELEREAIDIKAQISTLRGRSTDSDNVLEKLKHEVLLARRRFEEAQTELETLESESATLQSAEQEVKDQLDSLRKEEKQLRAQINNVRLASSDLSMKKLNADREMQGVEETIEKLKKEVKAINEQNEKERKSLGIMMERKYQKELEVKKLQEDLAKAEAEKTSVKSKAAPIPKDDFDTGFDPFGDVPVQKKEEDKKKSESTKKAVMAVGAVGAMAAMGGLSSTRSIGSDSSSGMEPPPLPPDPFPGEGDQSPPDDPFAIDTISDPEQSPGDPFQTSDKPPEADPFAIVGNSDEPPDDPFAAAAKEKTQTQKDDPFAAVSDAAAPMEDAQDDPFAAVSTAASTQNEEADPFAAVAEENQQDPFASVAATAAKASSPQVDPFASDANPPATTPPDDPFDSTFDPFASMDAAMAKSDPFASAEVPAASIEKPTEKAAADNNVEEEVDPADFGNDPFFGAEDPIDIDENDPFAAFDDDLDEEFPEADFD